MDRNKKSTTERTNDDGKKFKSYDDYGNGIGSETGVKGDINTYISMACVCFVCVAFFSSDVHKN